MVSGAKFYIYGGGTWREVNIDNGTVEGWGLAKFAYARRGKVEVAKTGAVLAALRDFKHGNSSAVKDGAHLPFVKTEQSVSKRGICSAPKACSHRHCCHHSYNNGYMPDNVLSSKKSPIKGSKTDQGIEKMDVAIQTRSQTLSFPNLKKPASLKRPRATTTSSKESLPTKITTSATVHHSGLEMLPKLVLKKKWSLESSNRASKKIRPLKLNKVVSMKNNVHKRKRSGSTDSVVWVVLPKNSDVNDKNASENQKRTEATKAAKMMRRKSTVSSQEHRQKKIKRSNSTPNSVIRENEKPNVTKEATVASVVNNSDIIVSQSKLTNRTVTNVTKVNKPTKTDHLKELIIDESDVEVLRNFLLREGNNFDLHQFDADDEYKRQFFYTINPLVNLERSPQIAKMIQKDSQGGMSLKDFASHLGLKSTSEKSIQQRYKMRKTKERGNLDIEQNIINVDAAIRSKAGGKLCGNTKSKLRHGISSNSDSETESEVQEIGRKNKSDTKKRFVKRNNTARDRQDVSTETDTETESSAQEKTQKRKPRKRVENSQSDSEQRVKKALKRNGYLSEGHFSDSGTEIKSEVQWRTKEKKSSKKDRLAKRNIAISKDSEGYSFSGYSESEVEEVRYKKKPISKDRNRYSTNTETDDCSIRETNKQNKRYITRKSIEIANKVNANTVSNRGVIFSVEGIKLKSLRERKYKNNTLDLTLESEDSDAFDNTKTNMKKQKNKNKANVDNNDTNKSDQTVKQDNKKYHNSKTIFRNKKGNTSLMNDKNINVKSTPKQDKENSSINQKIQRNKRGRLIKGNTLRLNSINKIDTKNDNSVSESDNENDKTFKTQKITRQRKIDIVKSSNDKNNNMTDSTDVNSDDDRSKRRTRQSKNNIDTYKPNNTESTIKTSAVTRLSPRKNQNKQSDTKSNSMSDMKTNKTDSSKGSSVNATTETLHFTEDEDDEVVKRPIITQVISLAGKDRPGLPYSNLEDHAIVTWVSRGGRAQCVNGNRIWKELQDQYPNITGIKRTWHSLRNRYLRSILPRLGKLALEPPIMSRLRAAAATGEIKIKSKPSNRRNSIFGVPSVGALSRPGNKRSGSEDRSLPAKRHKHYSYIKPQPTSSRVLRSSLPSSPDKSSQSLRYSEITRRFGETHSHDSTSTASPASKNTSPTKQHTNKNVEDTTATKILTRNSLANQKSTERLYREKSPATKSSTSKASDKNSSPLSLRKSLRSRSQDKKETFVSTQPIATSSPSKVSSATKTRRKSVRDTSPEHVEYLKKRTRTRKLYNPV